MRVLLQTYAFYPVGGGVSRSVEMLAHALLRGGQQVRVATSSWVIMDAQTRHWIAPWQDAGMSGCRRFLFAGAGPSWSSRALLALMFLPYLAYLLVYRPHVVHLHFVNVDAVFTLWARRFLRFRLVTTCHGSDVHVHSRQSEERRQLFLRVIRASDRVTTVSQELKTQLLQMAPEARVEVIPNAAPRLPENSPSRTPRQPIFLFAGRLSEQKNPLLLLEAFARVADNRPQARLVFAGHGPLLPLLRRRVQELGLEARVDLPGWLDAPELQDRMEKALALVLPSQRGEGCPHVLLEAMAAETAVVAAAVGGMPELVGDAGLLFESGRVEQLARCLCRLLDDKGLAANLSTRASARLEQAHHPDRILTSYLEAYR